jgi:hypothetical protein
VTNRPCPKSLTMANLIRYSSPVIFSRVRRTACVVSGAALALLMSTTASAVLHEYRVHFEPSPTSSAKGYTLHIGPDAGDYSSDFDLGAPPVEGGTVIYAVDLEDSIDLYVALRAYDSVGLQSDYSNEIRVAAVVPPPAPPPVVEEPVEPPPVDEPVDEPVEPPPVDEPVSAPLDPPPVDEPVNDPVVPPAADPGSGGAADMLDTGFHLGLSTTADGLINTVLADGSLEFLTMDSLAAKENIRPVRCDLDGDGDRDLLMGFGPGSGGQVAVIIFENDTVSAVSTIKAGPANYRMSSGRTNPACGDLDGDGRSEIVIGFGPKMRGVVQIFDDTQTGFAPLASATSNSEGYMQIPVPERYVGSIHPAIGNVDGDARDELVAGLGSTTGGGRLVVLDDLSTDFEIHSGNRTGEPWLRVDPNPQAIQRHTRVMPALGDLDGDGRDEIVVSFGKGSGARIALLEDAIDGFPMTASDATLVTTGRPGYQKTDGATRSAFGDADGDGYDELIVGFRRRGRHEVQVFDDLRAGMRMMTADDGFISTANASAVIIPTPKN